MKVKYSVERKKNYGMQVETKRRNPNSYLTWHMSSYGMQITVYK